MKNRNGLAKDRTESVNAAASYPIIVRSYEPVDDLDERLRRIFGVLSALARKFAHVFVHSGSKAEGGLALVEALQQAIEVGAGEPTLTSAWYAYVPGV